MQLNRSAIRHNSKVRNNYGSVHFIVNHSGGASDEWSADSRGHLDALLKIEKNSGYISSVDSVEEVNIDQELKGIDLFNQSGAFFSKCRKYRYALWRIWKKDKPLLMFIGLNPSTANESKPDATIRSVTRITNSNGYGGFLMMNCFPFVSRDPEKLRDVSRSAINDQWLIKARSICRDVVFAWGKFDIVRELGRDRELVEMFPGALCLGQNSNGSPKHPLFLKSSTELVSFNSTTKTLS